MKIFSVVLALGLLAAILGMALVVNAWMEAEPAGYTVLMFNCGGEITFLGEHIASFVSLDEAKGWADERLGWRYDVAMIYALDAPSRYLDLLWIRDEVDCYGGEYREWTDPIP